MKRVISEKFIKELVKKEKKKIEFTAIQKISDILEINLKEIIKKASRNADFTSRKIIKKDDIKEE